LAGGEDKQFFSTARKMGARIVFASRAIVYDEISVSRLTYRRYVMRGLARGGQKVTRHRINGGSRTAAVKYAFVALTRITKGMVQLLAAPIVLPFSLFRFKSLALSGVRNIMFGVGCVGGIFLLQYEYYRIIDGF
jgi:hypothetical protein